MAADLDPAVLDTIPDSDEEERVAAQAYIRGLREMADWLEAHPGFAGLRHQFRGCQVDAFRGTETLPAAVAELMAGAPLGAVKKDYSEWYLTVSRSFGPHIVQVSVGRAEACEKVQVGTRVVEKPDPTAPIVSVEEPVYEWRCRPVLAELEREVL